MAHRKGGGSRFERAVCTTLSLWWSKGKRDDIYWRTAGSGGRATARTRSGKSTYGQHGDVLAVDPVGQPLLDLVTIELKHGYDKESAINAVDRHLTRKPSQWEGFVIQARRAAFNAGTPHWMLIHKRGDRRPMVYMQADLSRLMTADPPQRDITLVYRGHFIHGLGLDDFCQRVAPAEIKRLSKIRWRQFRMGSINIRRSK